MWPYIIIGIVILFAVALAIQLKNRQNSALEKTQTESNLTVINNAELVKSSSSELIIKFEDLPALTADEETQLVEIKDSKLLARIDNAVPGTIQAITNSGAVKEAKEMAKEAGKLYKAVIPEGAVLDKSCSMEGAYRASYREVANSIQGNANLVPVDGSSINQLAAVNVANAAMGVASMVVGQYYMTQINDKLEGITDGLDKISGFQNNEFKGKVYALVAEVQKSSTFQTETIENDELRKLELSHLKNLEHECAELLGQANLTIQDYSDRSGLDYSKYESIVGEAQKWFQYQTILLELMRQISDLSYALNLGAVSRENSLALFLPYANQVADSQNRLLLWHEKSCEQLKIDVEAARRERQGFNKVIMAIPALFDDNLHYKSIPKNTASQIRKQTANNAQPQIVSDDLFHEDVQLIAKDGKLYYLPGTTSE